MELTVAFRLPQEAASVPVVRHTCRDALAQLGVEDECVSDIELAVSEACSNVLRHAVSGRPEYRVTLSIRGTLCRIEVRDFGPGFEPDRNGARNGAASTERVAEAGRGLFLMKALVDEVDFSEGDGGGTVVSLSRDLVLAPDSMLRRRNRP